MAAALVAYLHFLAIFALFALLSVEHVLFKAPLDLARARSLMITDLVYGICAGLVLATGVARVLWFGKGAAYYMGNSLFHAKLAACSSWLACCRSCPRWCSSDGVKP